MGAKNYIVGSSKEGGRRFENNVIEFSTYRDAVDYARFLVDYIRGIRSGIVFIGRKNRKRNGIKLTACHDTILERIRPPHNNEVYGLGYIRRLFFVYGKRWAEK